MKRVVLGVFDERGDAERVLRQLSGSPLDLDAVAVLHEDPETQRALSRAAGLPTTRAVPLGLVFGALLGVALGGMMGAGVLPTGLLEPLGPLLGAALGALVGAPLGALLGAVSDTVPVVPEHRATIVNALDAGATAVLVRTDSMPTARAIRDLFAAAGSRELSAPTSASSTPDLHLVTDGEDDETRPDRGPPELTEVGDAPEPPDEHALFVPPWRRADEPEPPSGHETPDIEADPDNPSDRPSPDLPPRT